MTHLEDKIKKRKVIRNNEYYDTQKMFDDLYKASQENKKFKDLLPYITNEQNIRLAYRNIKRNNGGKTSGTNGHTIEDIANGDINEVIEYVRRRLANYHPHSVKRVLIPKDNGKTRPLGIPTIEDRLIQQCIKQVLEPICEAKFHKHSYGFRANRNVSHAIARSMSLINKAHMHYVVDIDIKGFFDNVDHGKLIKQMWAMGIRDKSLICIISKMLKAEIVGEGIPAKGTPQGGILSPLLANIVLNELDWWVSSQWETHKTHYQFKEFNGYNSNMHRALKQSNLKKIFIVRYADDFKIFCSNYKDAQKVFIATKQWLKERLHLEISPEKSKVTNLRKNYTDFLGFKLKAKPKNKDYVCVSHVADKQVKRITKRIRDEIKNLADNPTRTGVMKYNSVIIGQHNYYCTATNVNLDFKKIAFKVLRRQFHLLRNNFYEVKRYNPRNTMARYRRYRIKSYSIDGYPMFPIQAVVTKPPMNFSQDICNYTKEGREKIHKYLQKVDVGILRYIMCNPVENQSAEYNDNRISLYTGQGGLCGITKQNLEIGNMETHHKIPREIGGTDSYENLIWVKTEVHKLIHATDQETINKYLEILKLDEKALKKVNQLRLKCGKFKIER